MRPNGDFFYNRIAKLVADVAHEAGLNEEAIRNVVDRVMGLAGRNERPQQERRGPDNNNEALVPAQQVIGLLDRLANIRLGLDRNN